jgi:DNA-binding transcriptional MerR regulator
MSLAMHSPSRTVELTGFSLDTLRYYERIGLIEPVRRAVGGQRRYSDDDVEWLGILRCLRDTGMPIAQMREYAEQVRAGDETFARRVALLEEHDRSVVEQIEMLQRQRAKIREKIDFYQGALSSRKADAA